MTTRTILAVGTALAFATAPLSALAETSVSTTASADISSSTSQTGLGAHASANGSARIAAAKQRADEEIDRRVKKLNDLSAKIGGATHITSDQKASLTTTISGQISVLTTLKATVDADDSTTTLKADIQSITKDYRIFALVLPQVTIMAAADRVLTIDSLFEQFSAKLSARLATASSSAASLRAALDDYNAKVADAKVGAQAALDGVVGLVPDNGDQAVFLSNLSALKAARDKVRAAHKDLVAAREDAGIIVKGVAGHDTSVHAGGEASTSVETQ